MQPAPPPSPPRHRRRFEAAQRRPTADADDRSRSTTARSRAGRRPKLAANRAACSRAAMTSRPHLHTQGALHHPRPREGRSTSATAVGPQAKLDGVPRRRRREGRGRLTARQTFLEKRRSKSKWEYNLYYLGNHQGLSSIPSSSTPSLRGSNSEEVRSMEPEEKPKPPPPRLDCIRCFDALWFCYSPVHQMQTYYRHGDFDNCFSKWGDLVDCLALKTKPRAEVEEILIAREKARPHIWTYRTVDEASAHWWKLYRHKVMMSSPPKNAGSAAPKKS